MTVTPEGHGASADLRQRVQQLVDAWILRCRDCEAEAERFKCDPTSAEFGEWARTASAYRLCARELCDVLSSLDASGETPLPAPAPARIGACRDPLRLWFLEFENSRGVWRRYFANRDEARAALRALEGETRRK